MTFFIEWQVEGYSPAITKKETREEVYDYIKFLEKGGTKVLGIWCGERWFLHYDGKIYNFR